MYLNRINKNEKSKIRRKKKRLEDEKMNQKINKNEKKNKQGL